MGKSPGIQFQETAAAVLDTRRAYNDTVMTHGPETPEALEAQRAMMFAQLLATELISE